MQLRFVGCGDAFGSGGRGNTCFHVTGETVNFLIDCGASSLPALKRQGIVRDEIDLVLVTHFHGDHFAGLPFLLLDAQFSRRTQPLVIAGPEGIETRLKQVMEALFENSSKTKQRFDLSVVTLRPEEKRSFGTVDVTPYPVVHGDSGGPFLGKKPNFLVNVKRDHALQHPNWSMGAKITIDSATLMNKGLEMIEAKWLFNLQPDQVQVVIHPQSIIHSMIHFEDGSTKAQMGLPDMKLPIQYALSFPRRLASNFPRYDFRKPNTLTFEEPDTKTFRNLILATDALNKGGNLPCVLNAANETAVHAFIEGRIGFLDIAVDEHVLPRH